MTIATEINRSGPYAGTGTNVTFPYTFRIDDKTHLLVVRNNADGTQTTLTVDLDYTVSGVGSSSGGNVVLTTALAKGTSLVIARNQPMSQGLDLVNQGAFYPEDVEGALDKSAMRDQDLQAQINRAPLIPVGEVFGKTIPKRSTRANKIAAYDNDGDPTYREPTVPVISFETGDAVNVVAYGAVGDGATNNQEAFANAVAAAKANGSLRVIVPYSIYGGNYFIHGPIADHQDVTWVVDPRVVISGLTDLMLDISFLDGATVWRPTIREVTIKALDGTYNHQTQAGKDLDGEWIVSYQRNPIYAAEGSPGQLVSFFKSNDGGVGGDGNWDGPCDFTTDSAYCTNPFDPDGEPAGVRFTEWRTNVINFSEAGYGSRLWLTWGHGLNSSYGPFGIWQKTSATGKGTIYVMYQLTNGSLKFVRYGDTPPSGATFNDIVHEGRTGQTIIVHGAIFGTDGRLYLFALVRHRNGPQGVAARQVCTIICDDPSVDIEDMTFYFSGSFHEGDIDLLSPWEWDSSEVDPGWWQSVLRHNESEFSALGQEGGFWWVGWGDGRSGIGWQLMGAQLARDRCSIARVNPNCWFLAANDHPYGRANTAIIIQRKGGGFASGLPVTGSGSEILRIENGRFDPVDEDDTFAIFLNTATDTVISLTGAQVAIDWARSNGERVRGLADEGYSADYAESTIDIDAWPYFTAGDKIEAEVGGWYRELYVNGGEQTAFGLDVDLTDGSPEVTIYGKDAPRAATGGELVVDTAGDGLTYTGPTTGVDYLGVRERGTTDTATLGTGQSDIDFSASFGMVLVEDSLTIRHIDENDFTREIPEQQIILSTASGGVHMLEPMSGNDRLLGRFQHGELSHVPIVVANPNADDVIVTRAFGTPGGPTGGGGIKASFISKSDLPDGSKLWFTARRNAEAFLNDPNQVAYLSGDAWVFPGRASMGASLPQGRFHLSGWFKPETVPSGSDAMVIVNIGNYQRFIQLELAFNTNQKRLLRQVRVYDVGAGARDNAKPIYLASTEGGDVIDDGDGTYSMDANAWMTWALEYDSVREEVSIEGVRIPLSGPLVLGLGDYYLTSSADSTQTCTFDIEGSRPIKTQRMPDQFQQFEPRLREPPAPNLFLDPSLTVDPEIAYGDRPIQQPLAHMPGWSVDDRGGCSVSLLYAKNSQSASNANFGGQAAHISWNISNAVRVPASAATDDVKISFALPDVTRIVPGNYILQFFAQDGSDIEDTNTAQSGGLPMQIFFFQGYGERSWLGRKYYPIDIRRIVRYNKFFWMPVPAPLIDLVGQNIVQRDSSFGLQFRIPAGWNANLDIRYLDWFRGDAPRQANSPSPYDEDRTKRLFFQIPGLQVNEPMLIGTVKDASTAEFVVDFPEEMVRAPELALHGAFAIEVGGTQYNVEPSLVVAGKKQAVIAAGTSSATLTPGDPAVLVPTTPKTFDLEFDGASTLFALDENDDVYWEGDIDSVVHTDSAGSTSLMTANEDWILKPSFERGFDTLIGNGETAWVPGVSLASNITALSVLKFNTASGEESLAPGSAGGITWSSAPDGGIGTLYPLSTDGSADSFKTGDEYRAFESQPSTGADMLFSNVLAGSGSGKIYFAKGSGSALDFDARHNRQRYDYQAETETLWSAISSKPAASKAGRPYLKREIDKTIVMLKDAGIWAELDLLFCMTSHDAQSAKLNWKTPASYGLTATNAPVFTEYRGYTTDGSTSYLESSYTMNTNNVKYLQDDASLGFFVLSSNGRTLGGGIAGGYESTIRPDTGSGAYSVSLNGAAASTGPSIRDDVQTGYYAVDRSASTGFSYFGQGRLLVQRKVAITNTSGGLPTGHFFIGRRGGLYGSAEFAWAFVGGSMTTAMHDRFGFIMQDHLVRLGAL